jgi:hypothetical protein
MHQIRLLFAVDLQQHSQCAQFLQRIDSAARQRITTPVQVVLGEQLFTGTRTTDYHHLNTEPGGFLRQGQTMREEKTRFVDDVDDLHSMPLAVIRSEYREQ